MKSNDSFERALHRLRTSGDDAYTWSEWSWSFLILALGFFAFGAFAFEFAPWKLLFTGAGLGAFFGHIVARRRLSKAQRAMRLAWDDAKKEVDREAPGSRLQAPGQKKDEEGVAKRNE